MYQNNFNPYQLRKTNNGDRFIGTGFLGPFILGGITGGLLAPAFNRPYYGPVPVYPIYPQQYPIYQSNVYY